LQHNLRNALAVLRTEFLNDLLEKLSDLWLNLFTLRLAYVDRRKGAPGSPSRGE